MPQGPITTAVNAAIRADADHLWPLFLRVEHDPAPHRRLARTPDDIEAMRTASRLDLAGSIRQWVLDEALLQAPIPRYVPCQ